MSKPERFTNATGAPVPDNTNILTAGHRGPALLQDIWLIEKLAHFDREVITDQAFTLIRKKENSMKADDRGHRRGRSACQCGDICASYRELLCEIVVALRLHGIAVKEA